VKECAGFLVNRLLMPPMNEAVRMLQEGAAGVEQIDKLFTAWGMPMGPFTLADVVGIDVCAKVIHVLHQGLGDRYEAPRLLDAIYEAGWLGNKAGQGFYVGTDKERRVNPELDALIENTIQAEVISKALQTKGMVVFNRKEIPEADVLDRLLLPMINEAARILADGVARNAGDIDLAMIFGSGFPPFRGGLLKYADDLGIAEIVSRLKSLEEKYGPRFSPCARLVEMAAQSKNFYGQPA
jgi:3-hydroxyacyl-CoA dehydrogenase/enoyl-CoA hydratase/3-hydroxybutyryl-CoA epimerase